MATTGPQGKHVNSVIHVVSDSPLLTEYKLEITVSDDPLLTGYKMTTT